MKQMKPRETSNPHFVKISDVMRLYSVGRSKATELVKDSNAGHKIGQLILVDTERLTEYIRSCETFR